MENKNFVMTAVLLATAACVPMEQAALTYTSKTTMGVGLAAGTQDTPGLDVTIGFKESNVALVPVAVAKYCYKASKAQCQNMIYEMEVITGSKLDASSSQPVQKRLDEIRRELNSLIADQRADTDRVAIHKSQIASALTADEADQELTSIGNVTAETTEELERRSALIRAANSRPTNFDLAGAQLEVARLEQAQLARAARINALQTEGSQLSPQLDRDSNSRRGDALSVYGKFNGAATGKSQGAGLTAGKVFATGVAAQNLTEFATSADCLANIRFLAEMMPDGKDAEKASLLASAGKVCIRGE